MPDLGERRPLPRGDADDAHGAVRAGARDARRVRRRRGRQPAGDRSDGDRDAADADAAGRGAARPPRDDPDGRPRQLHDGDAQHRGAPRRRSRRWSSRYPETPNVHYAYGVFLLQEKPDSAIEEFKRELEIQPDASLVADADRVRVPQAGRRARPRCRGRSRRSPPRRTRFPRARRSARRCSRPATSTARSRELLAGIKLAPESPGLHFQLARAYQRAGRLEDADARAQRVHAAGSPGAHAAERRAVGRRTDRRAVDGQRSRTRSNGPRTLAVALIARGASRCAGARQQPPPQRARRDAERRRHRRPRRRRRPRQARAARARSDAGRLRGDRGRRAADDRIVHAGRSRARPARAARRRRRPRRHRRGTAASRRRRAVDARPGGDGARLRSPEPRGAPARGAGGPGLSRQPDRDAELHRHLRRRPVD